MKKLIESLSRLRPFDRTLIKSFAPIALGMATFMSVGLCFCSFSNVTTRIVGAVVVLLFFAGAIIAYWFWVSLRKELELKIGYYKIVDRLS